MSVESNNISSSSWFKKYIKTKYITAATFVLSSWGLAYNYLYYSKFGIDILKYISLQEILLDTITYVTVIIILLIIIQTIIFSILYYSILLFSNKYRKHWYVGLRIKDKEYIRKFLGNSTLIDLFIIMSLGIPIILGYTILKIDVFIYFKFVFPAVILAAYLKFIGILRKGMQVFAGLNIAFSIVAIIYISAHQHTAKTLNSKLNIKTSFEFNNGITYNTNDSIHLIGETSSTIFLYNNIAHNTIILSRSNLIRTTIINPSKIKNKGATN